MFSTVIFSVCEPVLLAFEKCPLHTHKRERIPVSMPLIGAAIMMDTDRIIPQTGSSPGSNQSSNGGGPAGGTGQMPGLSSVGTPNHVGSLTQPFLFVQCFALSPHVDYFELLITLHC